MSTEPSHLSDAWIPLEESGPPMEHKQVLVAWGADAGVAVAIFHDDCWFLSIGLDEEGDELATPTHWMPAPQAPKALKAP